jgi:general stress protein CsbA
MTEPTQIAPCLVLVMISVIACAHYIAYIAAGVDQAILDSDLGFSSTDFDSQHLQ